MVREILRSIRDDWKTDRAVRRGDASYIREKSPHSLDDSHIQDSAWGWFAHRMVYDSPEKALEYAEKMRLCEHHSERMQNYVQDRVREEKASGSVQVVKDIQSVFQRHLDCREQAVDPFAQGGVTTFIGIDY